MKLEVHERITLLGMLPKEGNYAALKTLRRAREMLNFAPEEQKLYEFKELKDASGKTVGTTWNAEKAAQNVKDCPVDEYTTDVIRDKLAQMNKEGKLTEDFMSLYEKFVVMYL